MFSRILGIPVLLGAAVAVPYLSTNGPDSLKQWWSSVGAASAESVPKLPELTTRDRMDPAPRGPGYEIFPVSTPLEGNPSVSLEEVFRFDVTKEWVYERWARKSTALAELGLYGVRVPLVTGTQIHDLAGSLTYFFDQSGKVQRISFKGNTGDTTKVIALAQAYSLQPQASAIVGEQLFQTKRGNDVFSELRTRPSSVLWSSSPHDSFAVELDLQRPEATVPLPSKLLPFPEVKAPATTAKSGEEQNAEGEKNSFQESMKAFFPRSRVPSEQVESLEKRDRLW
ncbi:MAG: DUF6690 family protein [Bythopirellula sp.]|nr:DUF6690 family protein [Bythopirellula sp.]